MTPELTRRGFFFGSAGLILTPGVLMPVKVLWTPPSLNLSEASLEDIVRRFHGKQFYMEPTKIDWFVLNVTSS